VLRSAFRWLSRRVSIGIVVPDRLLRSECSMRAASCLCLIFDARSFHFSQACSYICFILIAQHFFRFTCRYEPLYNHGLVPAFVCFLVGTSVACSATPTSTPIAAGGSSFVARALEHDILTSLGACSFEVFLFQWPIHAIVTGALGNGGSAEVFVCMCLVLWGSAAAYVAYVEAPLVKLLRSHTEQWGRQEAGVLIQEMPPFERVPTVEEHAQILGYGSTAA